MLYEVSIPPLAPRTGASYQQVARQRGGYAQAAAISVVSLAEDGRCKDVRLVLFSVGETPILSGSAAKMLVGQEATPDLVAEVARTVAKDEVDPGSDLHGSAEYRHHLVEVLSERSLTQAFERAK